MPKTFSSIFLMRSGKASCEAALVGGFGSGFAVIGAVRAALDDLGAFVHTKVVAIFTQFTAQRINRDDKFSFHTPVQ